MINKYANVLYVSHAGPLRFLADQNSLRHSYGTIRKSVSNSHLEKPEEKILFFNFNLEFVFVF